jgi:hypothetical protein
MNIDSVRDKNERYAQESTCEHRKWTEIRMGANDDSWTTLPGGPKGANGEGQARDEPTAPSCHHPNTARLLDNAQVGSLTAKRMDQLAAERRNASPVYG